MRVCGRCRRWGLLSHAAHDYRTLAHDHFIIGDPAQVAEEIQCHRELFGINRLICRVALPVGLTTASRTPCAHSASASPRTLLPGEEG
jgi:hypothetical protein